MKFLADQDVYVLTISFLRDLGHEVIPVAARAKDVELLRTAHDQAESSSRAIAISGRWSSSSRPARA
jgi:hypothetical protein